MQSTHLHNLVFERFHSGTRRALKISTVLKPWEDRSHSGEGVRRNRATEQVCFCPRFSFWHLQFKTSGSWSGKEALAEILGRQGGVGAVLEVRINTAGLTASMVEHNTEVSYVQMNGTSYVRSVSRAKAGL